MQLYLLVDILFDLKGDGKGKGVVKVLVVVTKVVLRFCSGGWSTKGSFIFCIGEFFCYHFKLVEQGCEEIYSLRS